MHDICGDRPLLGRLLVKQGLINHADVERALRAQLENGKPLGQILVQLGIVCRPALDRALAGQSGVELQEESGFGAGLRAEIERRHSWRRSRPASA